MKRATSEGALRDVYGETQFDSIDSTLRGIDYQAILTKQTTSAHAP
jgi:hypothetical protein